MLTTHQGDERDHQTSAIYYQVADIRAAIVALKERGLEFEREPQMAAKMPDHELWLGFLRAPDHNLLGIMAEMPLSSREQLNSPEKEEQARTDAL